MSGGAEMPERGSLFPSPREYVADSDFVLYLGDACDVLKALPDCSVHMAATSPPFYGLRDYGVDGQIGLEATPDEWVARLVDVFRELRRVLRDDGTFWLELGDSYSSQAKGPGGDASSTLSPAAARYQREQSMPRRVPGYKAKDLVGQPWMLAFALRADGWFLRSEIIWHRPNPMPESVVDRPTKAHSTVFLLTKRARYFYDADAIRDPYSTNTHSRGKGIGVKQEQEQEGGTLNAGRNNASFGRAISGDLRDTRPQAETLDGSDGEAQRGPDGRRKVTITTGEGGHDNYSNRNGNTRWPGISKTTQKARLETQSGGEGTYDMEVRHEGANARSVWRIPTEPTPFAHFATWPQKLVERMILAGCPVGGTVLDPFMGSGTTALVARRLGRKSIGIELSPEYAALCATRLGQQSLLTEAAS